MFSIIIKLLTFVIILLALPYIIALITSLIGFLIGLIVRIFMLFSFIYFTILDLYEKFGLLFIVVTVGFMISVFMYIRKKNS